MRNDWKDHLLSSVGRSSRAPFAVAGAAVLGVLWAYRNLLGHVAHMLAGWMFWPIWLFCAASVLAKRLHDRGRSGWWSAIILLAVLLAFGQPSLVVAIPCSLVLAWSLIDLGLMPGEPGSNRYGPNPVAPLPATGA
jgi:uncharacterized membrane protein YhaH (DUF805 family)